jgi:hypothetical protein
MLILMFVLFVHSLQNVLADIFSQIYKRSVGHVHGLARLLTIKKLATPEACSQYQVQHSLLCGRPFQGYRPHVRGGRRYHGDLKSDIAFSSLEMSDYDIVNLDMSYGPGGTPGGSRGSSSKL